MGKTSRSGAPELPQWAWVSLKAPQQEGRVGKRGEREEVGKITGPPPTPSASLLAPVLSGGVGDEALKAFQQELRDCVHVLSTCMRAQSHLCKKKKKM